LPLDQLNWHNPASEVTPGTVELKLESTVKIQPQNPVFRFIHRVSHADEVTALTQLTDARSTGRVRERAGHPGTMHRP